MKKSLWISKATMAELLRSRALSAACRKMCVDAKRDAVTIRHHTRQIDKINAEIDRRAAKDSKALCSIL